MLFRQTFLCICLLHCSARMHKKIALAWLSHGFHTNRFFQDSRMTRKRVHDYSDVHCNAVGKVEIELLKTLLVDELSNGEGREFLGVRTKALNGLEVFCKLCSVAVLNLYESFGEMFATVCSYCQQ